MPVQLELIMDIIHQSLHLLATTEWKESNPKAERQAAGSTSRSWIDNSVCLHQT